MMMVLLANNKRTYAQQTNFISTTTEARTKEDGSIISKGHHTSYSQPEWYVEEEIRYVFLFYLCYVRSNQ